MAGDRVGLGVHLDLAGDVVGVGGADSLGWWELHGSRGIGSRLGQRLRRGIGMAGRGQVCGAERELLEGERGGYRLRFLLRHGSSRNGLYDNP